MSLPIRRRDFFHVTGGVLAVLGGNTLGLFGIAAPRRGAAATIGFAPIDITVTPENPFFLSGPSANFGTVTLRRGGFIQTQGGCAIQIASLVKVPY